MRSWVFRHRLRLRAVYGPLPVPRPSPRRSKLRKRARDVAGLRPGEWLRKGPHFVLRPMTPPAA
jgi:hypothetical protein